MRPRTPSRARSSGDRGRCTTRCSASLPDAHWPPRSAFGVRIAVSLQSSQSDAAIVTIGTTRPDHQRSPGANAATVIGLVEHVRWQAFLAGCIGLRPMEQADGDRTWCFDSWLAGGRPGRGRLGARLRRRWWNHHACRRCACGAAILGPQPMTPGRDVAVAGEPAICDTSLWSLRVRLESRDPDPISITPSCTLADRCGRRSAAVTLEQTASPRVVGVVDRRRMGAARHMTVHQGCPTSFRLASWRCSATSSSPFSC